MRTQCKITLMKYIKKKREELKLAVDHPALLLFENFKVTILYFMSSLILQINIIGLGVNYKTSKAKMDFQQNYASI